MTLSVGNIAAEIKNAKNETMQILHCTMTL